RACRIFPLRFTGHAVQIVYSGLPVKPANKMLRIEPAHAHGRARASSPVAIVLIRLAIHAQLQSFINAGTFTPAIAYAGFPLVPCHRRGADGKGARKGDSALI